RTSAGSSKLRPRSRQKEHLQPYRPASHPARLQPPLPRIPLQSGRLLGWYPSARPSHPTSPRQRPHRQRPQLLQPPRTDPAFGPGRPPPTPRPAPAAPTSCHSSPNPLPPPSPDTSPASAYSVSSNVSPAPIATISPARAVPPSQPAAVSHNSPSFRHSPNKSAHTLQTLSL